jgi:hypothetical protein
LQDHLLRQQQHADLPSHLDTPAARHQAFLKAFCAAVSTVHTEYMKEYNGWAYTTWGLQVGVLPSMELAGACLRHMSDVTGALRVLHPLKSPKHPECSTSNM